MLADGSFDAVDVCLPTDMHPAVVTAALTAGFDVFCEKPLARTAAAADALAAAARSSGRLVAAGHCVRHWPAYAEASRIVASGRHGAPRYAELTRLSAPPTWSAGGWLADPARSGNAALDLHVHDADMVLQLFGPPVPCAPREWPTPAGATG